MAQLDEKIMKELMQTFRAEGAEYLQIMNQALLRMERSESQDERVQLLQEGFRAAHSLKGAARAVNLLTLEELTHDVESIMQQAHKGDLVLDAPAADVLYDAFDLMTQLVSGQEEDITGVQTRLREILGSEAAPEIDLSVDTLYSAAQPTTLTDSGDETIRVSIEKLDDLMAQVGELVVAKINAEERLDEMRQLRLLIERWPKMLREIKLLLPSVNGEVGKQLSEIVFEYADMVQTVSKEFEQLNQHISRDARRLEMVANNLQEQVRQVRMVPFANIALILERTVRDTARVVGKEIDFVINGKQVELDKKVLETLKDPLLHLLRNAVYHGIEMPDEREVSNKPRVGCVQIDVQQRGNEVRITVSDDGRGFDVARLRQAYNLSGHGSLYDDAEYDDVVDIAFRLGVSTAEDVNEIAGRGVGLDIVRKHIESIRGRIQVDTQKGHGTSFVITAPTSLAITRALLVRVNHEQYVVPLLSIEKIVVPEDVASVGGKLLLTIEEERFPLYSMAAILERPLTDVLIEAQLAIILSVGAQRIAILVDDVLTEVELSVMPLGDPLRKVRNVLGAALLGNGEPVVMLNPADLVKSARGLTTAVMPKPVQKQADVQSGTVTRILVVDDSITTRTLEKNILQMAGYDVTTATNGREALQTLSQATYDIVISDVQMPHMSGIELARAIRSNEAYEALPLILVTSLESREDRQRGLNAGANAYIVKRGFDQEVLLRTIQQLV